MAFEAIHLIVIQTPGLKKSNGFSALLLQDVPIEVPFESLRFESLEHTLPHIEPVAVSYIPIFLNA
jgi:hypothetical protein